MIDIFEYRLTVTEQDIDDLDHAGNFHYVKWMQQAAVAHSTALGWPPEKYFELGAGWVVRSHNITYLKPAYEGDCVVIRTWVSNIRPVTSMRQYEILNESGDVLAKAETDWAFVNYETEKPTRIPALVSDCFTVLTEERESEQSIETTVKRPD
jgi:acyl-CoA thioester hydrolase